MSEVTAEDYGKQVIAMSEKVKQWMAEHPGTEIKIQFNFPEKVFVVAAISDAIKNKFVITNEAGLELIKAISNWGDRLEASVAMVRMAVESAYERPD